jgi:tetraacyldisaccharide 4'-kinase
MLQFLEDYWRQVVKQERNGLAASLTRTLLAGCSQIYRAGHYTKSALTTPQRPRGARIVSIGNIVTGGTGKTPLTILLAKALSEKAKLAVLSRGYRSPAEHQRDPLILSEGSGPRWSAQIAGDEPVLISRQVPHAHVYVGKNRVKAAHMAIDAGCQLLLLDDGMQHRRLARDIDIAMLDADDPFGQGYLLPRGFLREDSTALGRANLIVINHVQNEAHFDVVSSQVKAFSKAPLIGTQLVCTGVKTLDGQPIALPKGSQVGVFCGIAQPEKFVATVEQLGYEVIARRFVPDHRVVDLEALATPSNHWWLCTEKDAVKLPDTAKALSIAFVQVELKVVINNAAWESFLPLCYP